MKKFGFLFLFGIVPILASIPFLLAPFLHKEVVQDTLEASVGFSPKRGAQDLVIRVIGGCQKELRIAAYGFTSLEIEKVLATKSSTLDIKVVVDDSNDESDKGMIARLENKGIQIRSNHSYSIHHHKFMICDGKVVQTGSFNYTASANSRNAENVLVLWNAPGVAKVYLTEWARLWAESRDVIH